MQENIFFLEIIPAKIPGFWGENVDQWKAYKTFLAQKKLKIVSFQALLAGTQNLYLFSETQNELLKHVKKCLYCASVLGVKQMVFGMPKNRIIPQEMSREEAQRQALAFFQNVGKIAEKFEVIIGLEANAPQYGGNFLTKTEETIEFLQTLNHPFVKLNLDTSTLILNQESLKIVKNIPIALLSHVHLSAPFLGSLRDFLIKDLYFFKELFQILEEKKYQNYYSIEMLPIGAKDLTEILKILRNL